MVIKLDTNVQDTFLSEVRDQQIPVVLYTINGFQIRGIVLDYDELSILVKSDTKKQMVYKHALSTVAPFQERQEKEAPYSYNRW